MARPLGPKTFAVIGLGSIGLRHAKNLLLMGHTVLGYDTDAAKMLALASLENDGRIFQNVGWFRPDSPSPVDGMIIATPSSAHAVDILETPIQCPTFVEKPIGISESDLIHLRGNVSDRLVMVGNNLRFHGCVKRAKAWMPLIGDPIWASFTVAQQNTKYKEHVILNWGAHEVDLAMYLLGNAEVAGCIGTDQIVDMALLHKNGCRTAIHMDYLSVPHARYFVVRGVNGYIRADLEKRTAEFWHGAEVESFEDADSWDRNYIEEMQAFIDRIDGEKTLGATGEQGLACLELLLEAKRICGG